MKLDDFNLNRKKERNIAFASPVLTSLLAGTALAKLIPYAYNYLNDHFFPEQMQKYCEAMEKTFPIPIESPLFMVLGMYLFITLKNLNPKYQKSKFHLDVAETIAKTKLFAKKLPNLRMSRWKDWSGTDELEYQKSLLPLQKATKQKIQALIQLGNLEIIVNSDETKAMKHFRKALEFIETNENHASLSEILSNALSPHFKPRVEYAYQLFSKEEPDDIIKKTYLSLMFNNPDLALTALEHYNGYGPRYLKARIANLAGKHELSRNIMHVLLIEILNDPNLKRNFFGNSKNNPFELEGFLEKDIVFKPGNPNRLRHEEKMLNLLNVNAKHLKAPLSLGIYEINNRHYLVLDFDKGRSIQNKEETDKFLDGYFDLVANASKHSKKHILSSLDYTTMLQNLNVITERLRNKLAKYLHPILAKLNNQSRVFIHGDLHEKQIIIPNETKLKITLLDLEHATNGVLHPDLAGLIDFPSLSDSELTDYGRRIRELKQYKPLSVEQNVELLLIGAVDTNLRYYLSSQAKDPLYKIRLKNSAIKLFEINPAYSSLADVCMELAA